MARVARLIAVLIALSTMACVAAVTAETQGRRGPGRPPLVRARVVFVGGYYYDPFFGPYPWWAHRAYPYPYFPVFDSRAEVRVLVVPKEAGVYVDGFYAGIVEDFDGFFERLPLPPGAHLIEVYLEGYRTIHERMYLRPGGNVKLHAVMEPSPPGVRSELPAMSPPVPPPPEGTFIPPRTPPRAQAPQPATAPPGAVPAGWGTLALRIEPSGAEVVIDGQHWLSSDGVQFTLQLAAGSHRVEVTKGGYQPFSSSEVVVRDRETTALNVCLAPAMQGR